MLAEISGVEGGACTRVAARAAVHLFPGDLERFDQLPGAGMGVHLQLDQEPLEDIAAPAGVVPDRIAKLLDPV